MEKGVLILGNGFDLDLGLKTSYSNFMDSEDFKAIVYNNYFARYLQDRRERLGGNWIDIENEIKSYVHVTVPHTIDEVAHNNKELPQFKKDYYELIEALKTYLSNIDLSNINIDSCAAKILKAVINNGYFSILSYNYTDLKTIASQLSITKLSNRKLIDKDSFVKNIHGSIKDKNIILGVEDGAEIDKEYCYVVKSMSQYFKSNNVRGTLEDADIVLFFGHSLGETDYLYFEEFFSLQSKVYNEKPKRKYIRFFTKDEESRIEIMYRLRKMNNKQTSLLYDLNDFRVYKTTEDDNNIKEVIDSLEASRNENISETKPKGLRRIN